MEIELQNDLYFREKYLAKIRNFYHETELIKVITGVRRCGKSSLMHMNIKELLNQGVSNLIYFTSISIIIPITASQQQCSWTN